MFAFLFQMTDYWSLFQIRLCYEDQRTHFDSVHVMDGWINMKQLLSSIVAFNVIGEFKYESLPYTYLCKAIVPSSAAFLFE